MNDLRTSYLRLESDEDEQAYLVHDADGNKGRWHHIEDLDSFFTRVYQYHQNHGFACILLQQFFELVQFVFVIVFATFLLSCVDYDILFANNSTFVHEETKVTLSDAVYSSSVCSARIGQNAALVICLFIASCFWLIQLARVIYNFFRLSEIRGFFTDALHIKSGEIDNVTWHEVQRRLMLVQKEQQLCIHKQELTELDIYHRILRFKNFMIAMANKDILPLTHRIVGIGEVIFLSQGLKYNLELILFWGPRALFANTYNLKDEYKRRNNRSQLITQLSNHIWWVGVANLLLAPVILVWQVLYSFFSYVEILKREPGSFGARRWSLYSRLYLRHFNELSHEFQSRLNRAYKPSTQYMDSFNSPVLTIFAKNITFFVGSILAVLLVLTIWDEDVLRVEHVLTAITLCTITITICKSFIPDEHAVSCPEQLMRKVLAQVHYVPETWRGKAHTNQVRDQFAQLFQYKIVYILEELFSPLITPFVLMFSVRSRAHLIVDFFHNFTVEVTGVGDVCSFAQMDVRRHGDPKWQILDKVEQRQESPVAVAKPSLAGGGKVELSLMHFAITNPLWSPNTDENKFLQQVKIQAHADAVSMNHSTAANPLMTSLNSLGALTVPTTNFLHQSSVLASTFPQTTSLPAEGSSKPQNTHLSGGISSHEGPLDHLGGGGIMTSVMAGRQGLPYDYNMSGSIQTTSFALEQNISELGALEMSLSALYMHELHHRKQMQETRGLQWETITEEPPSGAGTSGDDEFTSVLLHQSGDATELPDFTHSQEPTAQAFEDSDSDEAPHEFHLPEDTQQNDSIPPIAFTFQPNNEKSSQDKF